MLAASDPRALWYLTRGTGIVALILLTATVAMGVAQVARYSRSGLPRFVLAGLHRNVSLLAVALLAVHIVTAVADPFAPIHLLDVVIPFAGAYRPIWLGFGAVAFDLLVALVVTSLVRERIGLRAWRVVHWCAYACWPVALVHALGTGSDARLGWVQLSYALCTAAVVAALAWRLTSRWAGAPARHRTVAALSAAVLVVVVAAWSAQGPLRPGWARRAGTPPALLGTARSVGTAHR